MSYQRTEAIVLRRNSYGESDIIIKLLTRDFGKITAIAKGGKRSLKRFMGGFEPFSHVSLQFYEKELLQIVRILTCEIIDDFVPIREELERFYIANYMVELTECLLPEREKNHSAFELLLNALRLCAKGIFRINSLMIFELRMLILAGYRPAVEKCLFCGTTDFTGEMVFFHTGKGGVICENCGRDGKNLQELHTDTLRTIRKALRMDLAEEGIFHITEDVRHEWAKLLRALLLYHTDLSIKSMSFVYHCLDN